MAQPAYCGRRNGGRSNVQIAYADAVKIEPDFEVGEEVTEEVKLGDFGRRAVLAARQNLVSRILELEKDGIYKKYKDRAGEILTGEVYQVLEKGNACNR